MLNQVCPPERHLSVSGKKFSFLIVIILFISLITPVAASGIARPVPAWSFTYDSGAIVGDLTRAILATSDGGFTTIGTSFITGLPSGYAYKIDQDGNFSWTNRFPGWAGGADGTSDGGYFLSSTSGTYSKVSPTGQVEWTKDLTGDIDFNFYSSQETTDGGYILAGQSYVTENAIVVKVNSNGEVLNYRDFNNAPYQAFCDIRQTSDGGYIVVGYQGFGSEGSNDWTFDGWVVKLDSDLNIEWQHTFSPTSGVHYQDFLLSVRETRDHGFIALGETGYVGGDDWRNIWVLKLNPDGSTTWQRMYGGSEVERAASIFETPDDKYIFAGTTHSNDGDVSGNHGYGDIWVVKINQTGDIIWQKCFGNANMNWAGQVSDIGDESVHGSNANDHYRGGYQVIARNAFFDYLVSGSTYQFGGNTDFSTFMFTDVVDPPFIEKIVPSPYVPLTEKELKLNAVIKDSPSWEVTGIKWELYNKEGKLVDEKGSSIETINPYTYSTPEGAYGVKNVECTLYAKHVPTGYTYFCDTEHFKFSVFFPIVISDEDWEYNPPNWALNRSTGKPNWFVYWKQDKAIEGFEDVDYSSTGVANAKYDPNTDKITLGPKAPVEFSAYLPETGLKEGNEEKFFSERGIVATSNGIWHEIQHKVITHEWDEGGAFHDETDSDRLIPYELDDQLPDKFEAGLMGTSWEPVGSLTDMHKLDTYALGGPYRGYGDQEYLCWRAGQRNQKEKINEDNDWSDEGTLAQKQLEEFTKMFGIENPSSFKDTTSSASQTSMNSYTKRGIQQGEAISSGFTGNYSENSVDNNRNGLIDILTLTPEVAINESWEYSISGWLSDSFGNEVAISHTIMELDPGIHNIPLNFSGTDIRRSCIGGPYTLSLILSWGRGDKISTVTNAYTTNNYSIDQFEGSQISSPFDYRDMPVEENGDGIIDSLRINFSINSTSSTSYRFSASLYKDTEFLTSTAIQKNLDPGINTIDLLFNGISIASNELNGPYTLKDLVITDEKGETLYYASAPYTSSFYEYSQFAASTLQIEEISDHGSDLKGDDHYEFLTLNLSINVTGEGNYTFFSSLLDQGGEQIATSYEELYLNSGPQVVGLDFDGSTIRNRKTDGPYTIPFVKVEDGNGDTVTIKAPAHVTGPYQYTQFSGLLVNLTGDHSDNGIDTDGNGLFEVLSVNFTLCSEDAGAYAIGANLVSTDGTVIDWDQITTSFTTGETKPIRFQFDGTKISELKRSGSFTIENLVIYEEASYEVSAISPAFTTSPYLYSQFEKYGIVTGNVTSEFGLPLKNVQIKIEGKTSNITDIQGKYILKVFPGGTYQLQPNPPSHYNLTSETANVLVIPGSETIQDFILHSDGSPAPIISTITPSGGIPGEIVPFTMHGHDFMVDLQVFLNRTAYSDHIGTIFNTSSTTIEGYLNLTGMEPGVWNLKVMNPDGQIGILDNGFRVYDPSIPGPVVNFTANISSGASPLAVQFTDLSTGNPLSWHWDFDDNTTSEEQNPVHIFTDQGAAPGETKQFAVELRVENEGGYATSSQIISVTASSVQPVANFTPLQQSGSAPLSVQFTDTSQQGPTSWYWDFGDASNATVQNPTHIYTTAGNYTVSLTAANSAGSDTITRVDCINVSWHAPEISYISPEKGGQGSDIDIYISGMYFRAGAIAGLERESAVIPIAITDIDPHGLYGTLSIPIDAALGDWNVTVRQDGLVSNRNVVFQVVTPVPAEPGWMFRADERHSGKYPDGSKIPNNLLNWSFETGGPVRSSPVVVNGIVYFGSNDGKLYALNAVNGTKKWSFSTGGEVRSTPAVVNNRVFFGSSDGTVYALNAATGSPLWNVTTGDPVRSSPLVIDNVVYIGSDDGKLYALHATNGSTRWSYQTGGPVLSSPAFNTTYLDWIFVGSDDRHLYVFNAENGNVISTSYPSTGGAVRSSPSVRRDMSQYCGSDDGWIWETMGPEGIRPAFFLGSPIQSSPAVFSVPDPVFPDRLVVGCDDGNISMFRLYPPFGPLPVPLWKYPTGGPVRSSPAVAHNTIFIGSNDGSVHAINASTGLRVWTFTTGGPVVSSPAVANGMVFIGSDDGTLYAIGNDTQEFPAPIVISITPDSGVAGTVVPVTALAGLHFQEHARVNLTRTGGPTVTMTSVAVHHNGTSISGDLNLAGVPEGFWDIVVMNPDGKSGSLHEAFTVRAPSELIASFVADPLSGQAPLTVQFNDTSVGNPTAWNWSLGDGSWFNTTNATSRNISKTYLVPGSYTVQLRVSNSGGSNTSLPGTTITVTEPPVAPTAAFSTTINHLSVNFTDQSSGTPPLTYAWDFGDGATSSQASPSHVYASAGTFPVTLTVTNSAGSDNQTQPVTVTQENTSITLLNPNGGEKWQQGSIQTLRWNYAGDPGTHVKIEALRGTQVLATVTSSYPIGLGGSGSYNLTFPYGTPLGSDYFIKVTSTSNATYTDTSDAPFTIIPPITVVSPNGGEDWQQGSTQTIQWNYIGNPGPTVKIEALRGDTVLAVISQGTPVGIGGTGSMNLMLPINAPIGTEYRIRVSSTSNTIYTDTSDAPFRISANTGSSIELVAPNGGENYTQGSAQTIRWNYTGSPGSTVKIEALRGDKVLAVVTPGTPIGSGGSGSFNLTFPYNTPLGSDYRIRVTSTSNPAWTDTSEGQFTISPAITVTSPDGGEIWQQGSMHPITWTFAGNPGPAVKIEALRGETVLAVVTPSTSIGTGGTGSYTLTFPTNTPLGNNYRIRVSSTSYPACTDTSNGMFAISAG